MNLVTDLNEELIRRYVRTLPIGATSYQHHYGALRRFRRFITTHATPHPLSQTTLVDWLKAMSAELAPDRVFDYARKLDAFLSWLVDGGQLSANPWMELRAHYGQRLAPIIRALLVPNPREALDALRPVCLRCEEVSVSKTVLTYFSSL